MARTQGNSNRTVPADRAATPQDEDGSRAALARIALVATTAPGRFRRLRIPPRQGTMRGFGGILHLIAVAAILMLVVGACSSVTSTLSASSTTMTAPTPPSAPSATVPPTSAIVASPTTSPTPTGPTLAYVALGDSLMYASAEDCGGCTSAAVIYGKQLETDLGTPVEVHNLTMHNSLDSAGLLGYLEDGAMIGREPEDVLKAVAAADVVSVAIGFNDIAFDQRANTQEQVKTFEANLDGILSRIDTLRAGKPTMVRVIELYNNGIAEKPESDPDGPGTGVSAWKPITEAQNAAICRIAVKHKAACVDIYHPFNGADGLSSPAAKGYLGPDGTHPSQQGQQVIADALAAAGYALLR